jgi:hypothetical protein
MVSGRCPPRLRVVRKHEQPVLWGLVHRVVNGLLHVANNDPGSLGVERDTMAPPKVWSTINHDRWFQTSVEEITPCSQPSGAVSSYPCRRSSKLSPRQRPVVLGKPLPPDGTSSVSVLCNSSNPVPSFVKVYVRRNPLVHDLGDNNVSWAVPTTRCGFATSSLRMVRRRWRTLPRCYPN